FPSLILLVVSQSKIKSYAHCSLIHLAAFYFCTDCRHRVQLVVNLPDFVLSFSIYTFYIFDFFVVATSFVLCAFSVLLAKLIHALPSWQSYKSATIPEQAVIGAVCFDCLRDQHSQLRVLHIRLIITCT